MFGADKKILGWLIISIASTGIGMCGSNSHFLNRSRIVTLRDTGPGRDRIRIRDENEVWISCESDKDLGYDFCRETALCRLLDFEGTIFNPAGKKVREIEKTDLKESSLSFYSVHEQHNTRAHFLSNPDLPYRVQRSKEYEIRSALFWPDWDPQSKVEVDSARLEVVLEKPLDFRYQNIGNVKGPDTWTDSDGYKHFIWTASAIPRFVEEYRYDPATEFQTGVKFSPAAFDLDGCEGSSKDWRSFGDWVYRLFDGQTRFTSPIPELNGYRTLADPRAKIKSVYRFLQKNARYVQIYLGIDGLKPHSVDEIRQARYGDCKDLSIYFIAMLRELGIQAYPALVLPRSIGVVDSVFPSNQFRHCIAVVPTEKDTLWMECTSDVTAYDDPPPNLEGTFALLIKPGDSQLIRIPESKAESNASNLNAVAELHPNRDLDVRGTLTLTGNLALHGRYQLSEKDPQKQRDWFIQEFGGSIGEGEIRSFSIRGLNNPDTVLALDFGINLKMYARKIGNRFMFVARLLGDTRFDGEPPEKRKLPLFNLTTRTDRDSVRFILPAEFGANVDTSNHTIASKFGAFTDRLIPTHNGILWTSIFTLTKREIPLAEYSDYYDFMTKTNEESGRQLILRTKEPAQSGKD